MSEAKPDSRALIDEARRRHTKVLSGNCAYCSHKGLRTAMHPCDAIHLADALEHALDDVAKAEQRGRRAGAEELASKLTGPVADAAALARAFVVRETGLPAYLAGDEVWARCLERAKHATLEKYDALPLPDVGDK